MSQFDTDQWNQSTLSYPSRTQMRTGFEGYRKLELFRFPPAHPKRFLYPDVLTFLTFGKKPQKCKTKSCRWQMFRLWGKSRGCRKLRMCFQYIYIHFGEKPIRTIHAYIACRDVKIHIDILISLLCFKGQICHHEHVPLFAALARKSHINWLVA